MAEKLSVSGRIYLVADMDTYVKREMRSNKFGMPFPLLFFFLLLHLNPKMRRLAYYGIRWEDFEVPF